MKIFVIRHAIAEDRDDFLETGKSDDLRPLTREGRKKMDRTAKGLSHVEENIPLILTSPLVRAYETAKILHSHFAAGLLLEFKDLCPGTEAKDTTKTLKNILNEHPKVDTVAMVGHEPDLGSLVSYWVSGNERPFLSLKKGSVTLVEFAERPEAGTGTLRWTIPAAILSRIR